MHHAKLLFYRILGLGGTSGQKPSSLIDLQCPYWPRCEILTAPANWEILLSRHVQVIMKEGMQDKKKDVTVLKSHLTSLDEKKEKLFTQKQEFRTKITAIVD